MTRKQQNIVSLFVLVIFSIIIVILVVKLKIIEINYNNSVNGISYNTEQVQIIDLSRFYDGDTRQRVRDINKINEITIHHTGSTSNNSIRDIYDIQCNKFIHIGICYHFVIRKDGNIYKCHQFNSLLSHAPNANTRGIAICLDGNFELEKPTIKQINSLKFLVDYIKNIFPNIKIVEGHQDVEGNNTLCPGSNLEQLIKEGL